LSATQLHFGLQATTFVGINVQSGRRAISKRVLRHEIPVDHTQNKSGFGARHCGFTNGLQQPAHPFAKSGLQLRII